MCHERLKVDFNSRANLLIGQNGSGKSAILTALIVGLGCRATATNRSKSIKRKCDKKILKNAELINRIILFFFCLSILKNLYDMVSNRLQLKFIYPMMVPIRLNDQYTVIELLLFEK